MILLSVFLCLIFLQMIPIPAEIMKIISPKTYELRNVLSLHDSQFLVQNSKFPISFVPFATRIEFFKWLILIGLFPLSDPLEIFGREVSNNPSAPDCYSPHGYIRITLWNARIL